MGMFLHELLMTYAVIVMLAVAGGFVLLPFRRPLPFALLAAPFAGLLCVVLGTSALYSAAGLSVRASGGIALATCTMLTFAGIAFLRPRGNRWDLLSMLAAALVVAPAVMFATEATTIRLRQPALLYMDGTDHLGYAQLGDWLRAHTVDEPPAFIPAQPYQAFPERLFHQDPRFGSFFTMALVGVVRRLPCAFAYDAACAIVLAAGVLAVAGAFARRSIPALFLLVAGLLTSHWYDFSRGGYFGKLLGYPAALLITGLFLSIGKDDWRAVTIVALAILTAGAALMHSGMTTGLFLASLLGGALACRLLIERRDGFPDRARASGPAIATLALLIVVAAVSSGTLARPERFAFPDWRLPWSYVLPRVLDLENQGVGLTGYGEAGVARLTALGFGLWAALALVALLARNAEAAGLLIGPAVLLLALVAAHQRAAAFQMIGTFYPFMLCAIALIIGTAPSTPVPGRPPRAVFRWAASALAILTIAQRVPRACGALRRYAGPDVPARFQYTRAEADRLAGRIGRDAVDVDVDEPNPAEFALVELSRRGLALRWSPKAWDIVAGYTQRPAPTYATAARYVLVDRSKEPVPALPVVERTAQYFLLDRRQ